jgi:hypothetical protein
LFRIIPQIDLHQPLAIAPHSAFDFPTRFATLSRLIVLQ